MSVPIYDKAPFEMTPEEYLAAKQQLAEQLGYNLNEQGEYIPKPIKERPFEYYTTSDGTISYLSPNEFANALVSQITEQYINYLSSEDYDREFIIQKLLIQYTTSQNLPFIQTRCILYPWLMYLIQMSPVTASGNTTQIINEFLTLLFQNKVSEAERHINYSQFQVNFPDEYTRVLLLLTSALILIWNRGVSEKSLVELVQAYSLKNSLESESQVKDIVLQLPRETYNIDTLISEFALVRIMATDLKNVIVYIDNIFDGMEQIRIVCSTNKKTNPASRIVHQYLKNSKLVKKINPLFGKAKNESRIVNPNVNANTNVQYNDAFDSYISVVLKQFTPEQYQKYINDQKDYSGVYKRLTDGLAKVKKIDQILGVLNPGYAVHVAIAQALGFIQFNRKAIIEAIETETVTPQVISKANHVNVLWDILFNRGIIQHPDPFNQQQTETLFGPQYTFGEFFAKALEETHLEDSIEEISKVDTDTVLKKLRKTGVYRSDQPTHPDVVYALAKMFELENLLTIAKKQGRVLDKELQQYIQDFKHIHSLLIQLGVPIPRKYVLDFLQFRKESPEYKNVEKYFSKQFDIVRKERGNFKTLKTDEEKRKRCEVLYKSLDTFYNDVYNQLNTIGVEYNKLHQVEKETLDIEWDKMFTMAKQMCSYFDKSSFEEKPKEYTPPPPPELNQLTPFPDDMSNEFRQKAIKLAAIAHLKIGCVSHDDPNIRERECKAIFDLVKPKNYIELKVLKESNDDLRDAFPDYQELNKQILNHGERCVINRFICLNKELKKYMTEEEASKQKQLEKYLKMFNTITKYIDKYKSNIIQEPEKKRGVCKKFHTFMYQQKQQFIDVDPNNPRTGDNPFFALLNDRNPIKQQIITEWNLLVDKAREVCGAHVFPVDQWVPGGVVTNIVYLNEGDEETPTPPQETLLPLGQSEPEPEPEMEMLFDRPGLPPPSDELVNRIYETASNGNIILADNNDALSALNEIIQSMKNEAKDSNRMDQVAELMNFDDEDGLLQLLSGIRLKSLQEYINDPNKESLATKINTIFELENDNRKTIMTNKFKINLILMTLELNRELFDLNNVGEEEQYEIVSDSEAFINFVERIVPNISDELKRIIVTIIEGTPPPLETVNREQPNNGENVFNRPLNDAQRNELAEIFGEENMDVFTRQRNPEIGTLDGDTDFRQAMEQADVYNAETQQLPPQTSLPQAPQAPQFVRTTDGDEGIEGIELAPSILEEDTDIDEPRYNFRTNRPESGYFAKYRGGGGGGGGDGSESIKNVNDT